MVAGENQNVMSSCGTCWSQDETTVYSFTFLHFITFLKKQIYIRNYKYKSEPRSRDSVTLQRLVTAEKTYTLVLH